MDRTRQPVVVVEAIRPGGQQHVGLSGVLDQPCLCPRDHTAERVTADENTSSPAWDPLRYSRVTREERPHPHGRRKDESVDVRASVVDGAVRNTRSCPGTLANTSIAEAAPGKAAPWYTVRPGR